MPHRVPRTSALSPGLLLAALLALAGGCKSAGEDPRGVAIVPSPDPEPTSIGFFLAQFDKSIARWNGLKLGRGSEEGRRVLSAVELELGERAHRRQDELAEVLESGASAQRQVAAVALGFTGNPIHLGPLLTALTDTDPAVVEKAALSIGILGLAEAPLSSLVTVLLHDPDPLTRANAAFAIQRTVAARRTLREKPLETLVKDLLEAPHPRTRRNAAFGIQRTGVIDEEAARRAGQGLLGLDDPDARTRIVAALAVLEPRLSHPDEKVREEAALAILDVLLEDPDPRVVSNAELALRPPTPPTLDEVELAEACRTALGDDEPGVRAQCASTLGLLLDSSSTDALGALLTDDVALVASASAASLARIGREHAEQLGPAARHLTGALGRVEAQRRPGILRQLEYLSQLDLGSEAGPWREWARSLP